MKKLAVLLLICLSLAACEKKEDTTPIVKTVSADFETATTYYISLSIQNVPCTASATSTRGVVWGTKTEPTTFGSTKLASACFAGGNLLITQLVSKTKYYVRAFATMPSGEVIYGNELTFTTP